MLKSDSIDDRSKGGDFHRNQSLVEHSITLSLRKKPTQRANPTIYKQEVEESSNSYNMDHHEKSFQRNENSSPRGSPLQYMEIKKSSIFTKAAQRKHDEWEQQLPETLKQEYVQKQQQEVQDSQQNLEELRQVIAKHIFINKWYQGPSYDRANDNFFIRDDKIIIIEDDNNTDNQEGLKRPEEILNKLVQSHINPTNYVLEKNETLDKVKEEGDRQQKLKKETETKKLIKNSDVKMTIYPAYDNFFKKQQ